jgi:glycosyltransferase involved in cell wall biosynthesis
MASIPNGFDHLNVAPALRRRDRFTIMHVGDFYRSRTPERLLEALCALNGRIEFVHIGPSSDILRRYADRLRIRHIERLPHADALELMKTASLLYLVQGWEDGVEEYVAVASKTYEYLSTGIPVLAEVPPGDNADIIRRYATKAWVVTSPTVDAVKAALQEALVVADSCEPAVSQDFIDTFSRQRLTGTLSAVLDRVSSATCVRSAQAVPKLEVVSQRVRADVRD